MVDTDLTARKGVNLVEGIILNDFGWVFREQHVSDEGVDAQVETKQHGKTTGRLLALQIKTGPSYFGEPKDEGWIFRFDESHARRWMDHALPVILVFVETEDRVAYWQRIIQTTVVSTGKNYKVHVPQTNQVTMARDVWEHFASGIENRAAARYEVALTMLPPSTARIIAEMHESDAEGAAVLALHLAEGRRSPRATVDALILAKPHWLPGKEGSGWMALALYAAAHEALSQSSEAFELAAAASAENRGKRLAAAGINSIRDDRERAAGLLEEAVAFPEAELLVRIGRAMLTHPQGSAGPFVLDPPLNVYDDQVRSDPFVQGFLCEQSIRAGSVEDAIRYARRAFELEPDNSDRMVALASALGRRSLRTTGSRGDMSEAASLLARALDQRHSWDGPTEGALSELARALTLTGDNEAVLRYCLTPPLGVARPEEARRPEVLRHALQAAHLLSQEDLVEQLSESLGTSAMDQLDRARLGLAELTAGERVALWEQVADSAEADSDYQQCLAAVMHLSRLGRDETHRLRPLVERAIIPASAMRLAAVIAQAQTDLDGALPELRTLARSDIVGAEHLVAILVDQNRFEEAAAACRTAHELFKQDYFLVAEARVYLDGGEFDRAETIATAAVRASDFPRDRGRLLTFLAERAADRGDWESAEDYLDRVLPLHSKTRASDVWRLVIAQLNRGEASRAAETVRRYSPSIRTSPEATLWLQAMASVPWDQAIASEALSLAIRFESDADLSLAILWHIIRATTTKPERPDSDDAELESASDRRPPDSRPVVTADLHKRAFAAIEQHVERNPESTAVKRLQGTTEELIDWISETLKRDSERNMELRELIEKVHQGNLPIGLLATCTGKSYALLLIEQATGPLVAAAADDKEHDLDQESATKALGQSVVVDTSALLLTSRLRGGGALRGRFADLLIPSNSRRDILRATVEVKGLAASSGSLVWDERAQRPSFSELSVSDFLRFEDRAETLESVASECRSRVVEEVSLFTDLADQWLDGAWLAPIQLAHDSSSMLWSDDLGQRRLARSVGVAAFGTPALVDALNEMAVNQLGHDDSERLSDLIAERQRWVREFVRESVVDVPAQLADLLAQAEADEWNPRSAATVLTRPSWWVWQSNALEDWSAFIRAAALGRKETTPTWQLAAMIGVARTYVDPEFSSVMLAVLATMGLGDGPNVDDAVAGLQRASEIARTEGLPDPAAHLPLVVSQVAQTLRISDPDQFAQSVLEALATDVETDDADGSTELPQQGDDPTVGG